MRLRDKSAPSRREPDLTSLINIVFLILIFFIVAGTLRPFAARDIQLAKTRPDQSGVSAPARLIVAADGSLAYAGAAITRQALRARLADDVGGRDDAPTGENKGEPFVIVADARAEAAELMAAVAVVRRVWRGEISILTQKQVDP